MFVTLKTRATASVLALALAAPLAAQAQDDATQPQTDEIQANQSAEATDDDAQVGGQPIEEAIEEADAPDTAETDPVNETASNEVGGPPLTGDQMGQTVMLDIDSFTQEIYERGFRQGYIRGIADARDRFVREMQVRRQQMMQGQQGGMMDGQQPGQMMQGQQQGQMQQGEMRTPGDGPISEELAARPGGSIIVLPPGVSPEAFIQRMMEDNERMQGNRMRQQSGGSEN
ncbi:hypothetical protein [Tranquillimonas alkanivorans]|uniref:Uncharacterized protein n=1 Tax=Tranquillimonas alkanivorans TaxID=441119 RepID=A0A1I5M0T9_9RHOB|nr:hypothetical protein [Tranquillimonas alkanivorans]SFP03218.1 hypothetical protein SAMN04488047_10231 [Tranquillimonas alkanivorans]